MDIIDSIFNSKDPTTCTYTENSISFLKESDDIFKVWPTNVDREHFRNTMTSDSPECLEAKYPKDGIKKSGKESLLIPKAYIFFWDAISNWLKDCNSDIAPNVDALWEVMKEHVLLVAIDLNENDSQQAIFETLNAKGRPLLPADLIKNFLLYEAEQNNEDVQRLYDDYWKVFDSTSSWRELIVQGRLTRPRVDIFLQHYLTLQKREETAVTHIFESYKELYKEKLKNASILSVDPQEQKSSADVKLTVLENQLKSFKEYSDVFSEFSVENKDKRIGLFFKRLKTLDTTTVYPLLLEVFYKNKYSKFLDSDLYKILQHVESYLIRRLICHLTSKNYNHLFIDLITEITEKDVSPITISDFLLSKTSETELWPDDSRVLDSIKTISAYGSIKQDRLCMILEAIDKELDTNKTEPIEITGKLTIEHIMPQKWITNWPLHALPPETDDKLKERRNSLIGTLGNLTLIPGGLNSAYKNAGWLEKRTELGKYSKLNMNRALLSIDDWNEDEIIRRAKILFDCFIKVWPLPVHSKETHDTAES